MNSRSLSKEVGEVHEKHGVVFILFDGEKINLEKRVQPGTSFFGFTIVPGGAIELGETQTEAVIREVEEEYGVEATEWKEIGLIDSIEEDGTLNIRHVFLVNRWKGDLANPEGVNEHLEATLEEAYELCAHPISKRILDLFKDRLTGEGYIKT